MGLGEAATYIGYGTQVIRYWLTSSCEEQASDGISRGEPSVLIPPVVDDTISGMTKAMMNLSEVDDTGMNLERTMTYGLFHDAVGTGEYAKWIIVIGTISINANARQS